MRFSAYCLAFCFEIQLITVHTKQSSDKLLQEEKVIIRLTFNPELALTALQTILPCFQQVNQTLARNPMETSIWLAVNFKKHVTSISCNLDPAMWSFDTDQRIPCYDRCQWIKA